MDVNYNTQSGMSIPLADIVESDGSHIIFNDKHRTQIIYSNIMTYINGLKYSQLSTEPLISEIIFDTPFVYTPTVLFNILNSKVSGTVGSKVLRYDVSSYKHLDVSLDHLSFGVSVSSITNSSLTNINVNMEGNIVIIGATKK